MEIRHELADPWKSRLRNVQRGIASARLKVQHAKASIYDLEQAIESDTREARNLVSLIVAAENLPESATCYTLSDDGGFLIGQAPDATTEGAE